MYYIDLSLKFLVKLFGQFIPFLLMIVFIIIGITLIKRDKTWCRNLIYTIFRY